MNNTPCKFERTENGQWKCTNPECGYVYRRRSSRPPVRLCGNQNNLEYTPTSKLTKLEINNQKPTKRPKKQKRVYPKSPKPLELGDAVHEALSFVGVTPEKVTEWLGRPCRCPERQEKFNELSRWVKQLAFGKTEDMKKYLEDMIK